MKGFLTGNYGLIPYSNQWMVISGNEQIKLFWCYDSGIEYINKLENKKESKQRKKSNKRILNSDPTVDTLITAPLTKQRKKSKV